jgi:hypothetical protein
MAKPVDLASDVKATSEEINKCVKTLAAAIWDMAATKEPSDTAAKMMQILVFALIQTVYALQRGGKSKEDFMRAQEMVVGMSLEDATDEEVETIAHKAEQIAMGEDDDGT